MNKLAQYRLLEKIARAKGVPAGCLRLEESVKAKKLRRAKNKKARELRQAEAKKRRSKRLVLPK